MSYTKEELIGKRFYHKYSNNLYLIDEDLIVRWYKKDGHDNDGCAHYELSNINYHIKEKNWTLIDPIINEPLITIL
jgi:hypothetical protein